FLNLVGGDNRDRGGSLGNLLGIFGGGLDDGDFHLDQLLKTDLGRFCRFGSSNLIFSGRIHRRDDQHQKVKASALTHLVFNRWATSASAIDSYWRWARPQSGSFSPSVSRWMRPCMTSDVVGPGRSITSPLSASIIIHA